MASTPDLIVAKAALTATLIRADANSLNRGDVNSFLQLLDSTLDECSRANVQKCKNWIVANVVPSSRRAAALGKYLVALSESMETDFDRPSVQKRRLHVLFVVSDVLHHVVRQGNHELARSWDAHLPALVAAASTFEDCTKHLTKVKNLLSLWEERDYLQPSVIVRLRDSFAFASDKDSGTRIQMSPDALKFAKEKPYVTPSVHGDPTAPWNDLPAASWPVSAASTSIRPMRRHLLLPVHLTPGPAKEDMANLVKSILLHAELVFQKQHLRDKTRCCLNLLGEVQKHNDSAPDPAAVDTYWGWSRPLCHRTKERRRKWARSSSQARLSRSRSRSLSGASSGAHSQRSPKRTRYASRSQSRDGSRSPRRRRGRSRSRSSSGFVHRVAGRQGPRTSSYSRSRSPAPPRGRSDRRRSYTKSMSRPSSRSPTRSRSGPRRCGPSPLPGPYNDSDRLSFQQAPVAQARGFPPIPPKGPGDFPVPPPPPPVGYQGIFPPLPPPSQGWNPNQAGFVPPQMMGGGWGAGPGLSPPPPPMPMPHDGQQQHGGPGGRDMGWAGGGGRGYRGRGRDGNGRGGYGGYGPR